MDHAIAARRNRIQKHQKSLACVVVLVPCSAAAGIFGEGYSSAQPGAPAVISFRVFTIYKSQEACEQSARPAEIRVSPSPLVMQIGDRVHRTNENAHQSELVVEACAANGAFLPTVPITVLTIDVQNVVVSRSDWDYFEAVREGEDDLVVAWTCATADGSTVEGRVRMIVISGDSQHDQPR